MKTLSILFSFMLFGTLFVACEKDLEPPTSSCISKKIKTFKQDTCDDAHVDEYIFNSEKVYVFELGTCIADGQSNVYDSECELLGSLGGINGNNTIQGQSFDSANFQQTIWKP